MYLVIGLGNPEEEYKGTRHNMGFDTINQIARNYQISFEKKKFDALYADTMIENEKVILIKPQTYMNLSRHLCKAICCILQNTIGASYYYL